MNYRPFIVEGKDPRPVKPFDLLNNYSKIVQGASFVHGFYTGAVIGFRQKLTKDIEALEDINLKDAKIKIKAYFEDHHGEVVEYSDLIDELRISLPLIVEACGELEKEGKIAPID